MNTTIIRRNLYKYFLKCMTSEVTVEYEVNLMPETRKKFVSECNYGNTPIKD